MQKSLGIHVDSSTLTRTRFPPEPSGWLHIGHVKAMVADFDLAKETDGTCILRFDDTNPETATTEFAEGIRKDIHWLGFRPEKVTYTSDYFEKLISFAEELIAQKDAYVCHMTFENIKQSRKEDTESPWRDRSTEESHTAFRKMQSGELQDATLRLRTPDRIDPVAYRYKASEHFRTGKKWRIYPSYEFSHCIVDSLEGITHSLCSKEFEDKRERYFWLLRRLTLCEPAVHEFSRLKLPDGQTSKRSIRQLISTGEMERWDDPRLLTVSALRRRGFPAGALLAFCRESGITKADSVLSHHNLMYHVRNALNASCPRLLAVIEPIRVTITNLSQTQTRQARKFPQILGDTVTYDTDLSKTLWISSQDFQLEPHSKFYGLAPGRRVLLKYAFVVMCTGVSEKDGKVSDVQVELIQDFTGKLPQGVISWVSAENCVELSVRQIPEHDDVDQTIYEARCMASPQVREYLNTGETFQIERFGFFIHDRSMQLIRTCRLRASRKS